MFTTVIKMFTIYFTGGKILNFHKKQKVGIFKYLKGTQFSIALS